MTPEAMEAVLKRRKTRGESRALAAATRYLLGEYDSISQAAQATGVVRSVVSRVVRQLNDDHAIWLREQGCEEVTVLVPKAARKEVTRFAANLRMQAATQAQQRDDSQSA